jgi:CelD/BcsL family acetyltransferase involved in cellulose biosynthesis
MTFQYDLTAKIVRPGDLSAEEIKLWEQFCNDDPSLGHPFFSFAFASAVDRVRPHVFVAVLRQDTRAVGFFPYQFSGQITRAMGAAERVGGNLADRFGVIAEAPLHLNTQELLGLARLNSLSYAYMPAEQLQHGFPKQRSVIGQQVRLTGDAASFWSGLKARSRKFATQLERKERVLERDLGPLRMIFQADPAVELPRLIEWKKAQYRRTGDHDSIGAPWIRDLFIELLTAPNPQCATALSTLYAGDTWLATHLGIMSKYVFHHWFPVHNHHWHRSSPGHILTKMLMLHAVSAGLSFFDFGGHSSYKDFFRPEAYPIYAGFLTAPNIGGSLSRVAASLAWRIEAFMRRDRQGENKRKGIAPDGTP